MSNLLWCSANLTVCCYTFTYYLSLPCTELCTADNAHPWINSKTAWNVCMPTV